MRDSFSPSSAVIREGKGSADPARPAARDATLGVLAETAPRSKRLGLYIHVPFCTKRCHYCSFNTAPLEDTSEMRRYVRALKTEIELLATNAWASSISLETVFFGGGTPSLLAAEDMAAILDDVRARFALERGAEVTVECNPESVSREKLAAYRGAGVNRISLGVQSLDDAILPVLGRLHDAGGARRGFEAVRAAGFDNVSVDLMYGLPAEGAVVEQYWTLARAAAARGFEHYEISNYARPGFRSRHNQIYWRAAEYLACGPGACGFVGDVRYGNVKPVARYCATLEDGALPIDTSERLTV